MLTLEHVCQSRATSHQRPADLLQFVQRKRALDLWRDIARALNSTDWIQPASVHKLIWRTEIPASNTRAEMRKFARDEFERNKDVYDLGHIRYLISVCGVSLEMS